MLPFAFVGALTQNDFPINEQAALCLIKKRVQLMVYSQPAL